MTSSLFIVQTSQKWHTCMHVIHVVPPVPCRELSPAFRLFLYYKSTTVLYYYV